MAKRWILVIDNYNGIQKNAINMLAGYISGLISYVLPVKYINEVLEEDCKENNIIAVGRCETHSLLKSFEEMGLISVPKAEESCAIFVGKVPQMQDKEVIAIAGEDERGVLYGCMQFINEYCNDILCKYEYGGDRYFDNLMEKDIREWKISSAPAIRTRAIWTWGHVIYDYKSFFENMTRLRLNEVVIWNDYVPFNAKDMVEYAHAFGIKVIWGFAWGWTTECGKALEMLCSNDGLKKLKESVLETYEKQYAATGADGIYFQTVSELKVDNINGKCVAEVVKELVNDISGALLSKYPTLHIQFGLHATSVKTHLDVLNQVDKRIHIVWEDCGAFPYHYLSNEIENFDETYAFTKNILKLRGEEERFGVVLKGMPTLDWQIFEHQKGRYILGEHTKSFMRERQIRKNKIWKIMRANWLRNAEYVRKMIALITELGDEPIVEALVEDAMFENIISLPTAIYAQTLWTPNLEIGEIIEKASKNPFVEN